MYFANQDRNRPSLKKDLPWNSENAWEKCIHFFRALPCIFMAGSWSDLCLGAWRRPSFFARLQADSPNTWSRFLCSLIFAFSSKAVKPKQNALETVLYTVWWPRKISDYLWGWYGEYSAQWFLDGY